MKKPAKYYVGKFVRHTKKAVKDGHPADRLFAVVSVGDEKGHKNFLSAWKCRLIDDRTIDHPALGKVSIDDPRVFNYAPAKNAPHPSGFFKMDSYYELAKIKVKKHDKKTSTTSAVFYYVDVDLVDDPSSLQDKSFVKFILKNNLMMQPRKASGPGGGWPIVRIIGKESELKNFCRWYAGDKQSAAYLAEQMKIIAFA